MNIALIAFDLDGTTIVQHKYLPQANAWLWRRPPAREPFWCRPPAE